MVGYPGRRGCDPVAARMNDCPEGKNGTSGAARPNYTFYVNLVKDYQKMVPKE